MSTERSFFNTGLDFADDRFTETETAQLLDWYRTNHDYRDMDLSAFARFWIQVDPGGFKRLKRHLGRLDSGPGALPTSVGVLMWVYTYLSIGNGKGALYEIISCRRLGVSKAQIEEVIGLAALVGGPAGMNPLGELAADYMREWPYEPSSCQWPQTWAPDVAAFRSGLDPAGEELSPGELQLVRSWFQRMHGTVPRHVDFVTAFNGRAYKTERLRFEYAVRGEVPAQLIPLLTLHWSVVQMAALPCLRSAELARALGVSREHIIETVLWAAVYGGDHALEFATTHLEDVFADWS